MKKKETKQKIKHVDAKKIKEMSDRLRSFEANESKCVPENKRPVEQFINPEVLDNEIDKSLAKRPFFTEGFLDSVSAISLCGGFTCFGIVLEKMKF
jgi:hypothetical protein